MKAIGIVLATLPAAVDHLLTAALHLRVLPLDRGEVEVLLTVGTGHARRGAAAETDEHGRPAEHQQLAEPGAKGGFSTCSGGDVAKAAGDHDRLVIAAQPGLALRLSTMRCS
jgi:hypothetical protein